VKIKKRTAAELRRMNAEQKKVEGVERRCNAGLNEMEHKCKAADAGWYAEWVEEVSYAKRNLEAGAQKKAEEKAAAKKAVEEVEVAANTPADADWFERKSKAATSF
jgi:hypothetical protein